MSIKPTNTIYYIREPEGSYTEIFFDDCSGSFDTNWEAKCSYYGGCYADFSGGGPGKMALMITEDAYQNYGANALSKSSWETNNSYLIEYNYTRQPAANQTALWSTAFHLVGVDPVYNTQPINWHRPEWFTVPQGGTIFVAILAASGSQGPANAIRIYSRDNNLGSQSIGGYSAVWEDDRTYKIGVEIDWVLRRIRLYIDDVEVIPWRFVYTYPINYIGSEFKINFFYADTYNGTGNTQLYDNIRVSIKTP